MVFENQKFYRDMPLEPSRTRLAKVANLRKNDSDDGEMKDVLVEKAYWYSPSVCMILLCMVCFVEYYKIDLFHGSKASGQAKPEYVSSTDDDLILCE